MTSNTVKNIPCKVDALSMTWSPEQLLHLKALAKTGATVKKGQVIEFQRNILEQKLAQASQLKDDQLKAAQAFDVQRYDEIMESYRDNCDKITREYDNRRFKNISEDTHALISSEVDARYELREMLKHLNLEVDTTQKYNDTLDNLLDNIGINLLDVLCCGEAERFVCRLNNVYSEHQYLWTIKNNPTGRFNYTYSANLYADGEQAGIIAWGGKNLGCYVSFMGTGCDALDLSRLYHDTKDIPGIKITRIDLAHDDFDGTRNIAVARKFAKQGGFNSGGSPAAYMYIESGRLHKKTESSLKKQFRFIPEKGRSLYVGSRESGKLLRIYEKGKQLGDSKSKWVRWELELHSSQRIIPLEAMIKPSEFLAGAYPALSFLNEQQCVVKTSIRKAKMTIDRIIENQVISTRKAINMMRTLCDMSDSEIIAKFMKGITDPESREWLPARLDIPITEEQAINQYSTT